MSENPIPKSPSSSYVRGDTKLTARGKNRQQESPPPTTPHQQDKHGTNNKKKEKAAKDGDVFTIDLMTPMTELQLAFFGDSLNTAFPAATIHTENGDSAKIPRASTPQAQKRKTPSRMRTSLPDRLHKSLPPIHSSASSTESGGEDPEPIIQQTNESPSKSRSRPATTIKTTREPKPQTSEQTNQTKPTKKTGPITSSEVQLFNRTTLNIAESISALKVGLQDVDKAIKADTEVIQKHQVTIQQLEIKRQTLLNKIKEKEEWLKKYSNSVQPLQDQITGLYEKVGQVRATLVPQKKL